MEKITSYFKKNIDLLVVMLFALVTMTMTPFEPVRMLSSINLTLILLLFCLMSIVAGLRKSGIFSRLYVRLFHGKTDSRTLARFFIFSCFFSSMFITNDVALIIFVPLAILVITEVRMIRFRTPILVWQTIAANMGSMLTPIGNPQNLFIYSYYGLTLSDFLRITAPIVLLSGLMIYLYTFTFAKKEIVLEDRAEGALDRKRIAILLLLFGICLLEVLRVIPITYMCLLVIPAIFLLDKKLFLEVDYKLLLLFIFLFIGVGNLGSMPWMQSWPQQLLVGNEFLGAILLSQIVSNVPATVMLAQYTGAVEPLLLGVNIGGLGTIIASMASVISIKAYLGTPHAKAGYYLRTFSVANVSLLCFLLISCWVAQRFIW